MVKGEDISYDREQYGFAVVKGYTELLGEVNKVIDKLVQDGEIDKMVDKYNVGE